MCPYGHSGSPCCSCIYYSFLLYINGQFSCYAFSLYFENFKCLWNISVTCYCLVANNIVNYTVRLAPEETSLELTGYGHNAVTCIGMKTDIPVKTGTVITIGILILIRYVQNNQLSGPIHNQIQTFKRKTNKFTSLWSDLFDTQPTFRYHVF